MLAWVSGVVSRVEARRVSGRRDYVRCSQNQGPLMIIDYTTAPYI